MEPLEDLALNEKDSEHNWNIKDKAIDYICNTTASWSFYIPTFATMEYMKAGMEPMEVLKSRFVAGIMHAIVGHPYQKMRKWLGKKLGVYEDSHWLPKLIVSEIPMVLLQPPTYVLILTIAGASPDEMSKALPIGLGLSMLSVPFFGPYSNMWRKRVFKRDSVFKKK